MKIKFRNVDTGEIIEIDEDDINTHYYGGVTI